MKFNDILAEIRSQFPALQRKIDGQAAVYFDGPAGTQVPQINAGTGQVIDITVPDNVVISNPPLAARTTTIRRTGSSPRTKLGKNTSATYRTFVTNPWDCAGRRPRTRSQSL